MIALYNANRLDSTIYAKNKQIKYIFGYMGKTNKIIVCCRKCGF